MCWEYTDLFYSSVELTNSASSNISEEARDKLLSAQANLGEQLLYEAANESWWRQPELQQPDFWQEVRRLRVCWSCKVF